MRKAGGTSLGAYLTSLMATRAAQHSSDTEKAASVILDELRLLLEARAESASPAPETETGGDAAKVTTNSDEEDDEVLAKMDQLRRALNNIVEKLTSEKERGVDGCGDELSRLIVSGQGEGQAFFWNEGSPLVPYALSEATYPHVYITHMREPMARIISNYKMHVRDGMSTGVFKMGPVPGKGRPPQSLAEHIERVEKRLANTAKQLATHWTSLQDSAAAAPDPAAQLKAITSTNLCKSFHAVHRGTTSLERSLARMARAVQTHLMWVCTSNYYVKRLVMLGLGPSLDVPTVVRLLRTRGTRADLEQAKAVLEQMDLVLISENHMGSPDEEDLVREVMGGIEMRLPLTKRQGQVMRHLRDADLNSRANPRAPIDKTPELLRTGQYWKLELRNKLRFRLVRPCAGGEGKGKGVECGWGDGDGIDQGGAGNHGNDDSDDVPVALSMRTFLWHFMKNTAEERARVLNISESVLEDVFDLGGPATQARLRDDNALDTELFNFARQLTRKRHAQGSAKHFLGAREFARGTDEVPSWCDYSPDTDEAKCRFKWPASVNASNAHERFSLLPSPGLAAYIFGDLFNGRLE